MTSSEWYYLSYWMAFSWNIAAARPHAPAPSATTFCWSKRQAKAASISFSDTDTPVDIKGLLLKGNWYTLYFLKGCMELHGFSTLKMNAVHLFVVPVSTCLAGQLFLHIRHKMMAWNWWEWSRPLKRSWQREPLFQAPRQWRQCFIFCEKRLSW